MAEAGINYYVWHLNHNNSDYKDGGTTPSTPDPQLGYGPYTHDYINSNGAKEGTYTLWIKPCWQRFFRGDGEGHRAGFRRCH